MAYAKKGVKIPNDFYEVKMGSVPVKLVHFQRNLGLNVHTDPEKEGYKKLINKWGYYFIPEVERIKSLGYRIQDIKNVRISGA